MWAEKKSEGKGWKSKSYLSPQARTARKGCFIHKEKTIGVPVQQCGPLLKSRPLPITVSDYLHDYITSNVCDWITWKITGWLMVKQSVCLSCSLHNSPNPHSAERANHMQCMFRWQVSVKHSWGFFLSICCRSIAKHNANLPLKGPIILSIHPFSLHTSSCAQGHRGQLGPIPAVIGRRQGTPWTSPHYIIYCKIIFFAIIQY